MADSAFNAFDTMIREANGTLTKVPGATVKVYDKTNGVALDDLVTDADGNVPGGTLPVAAGTLVYFSVTLEDGRNGWAWEVTF